MKDAEYQNIRRAYANLFRTPDGQTVLKDLEEELSSDTLTIVDNYLDPYASIAAAAYHKAYLYIQSMREAEDALT